MTRYILCGKMSVQIMYFVKYIAEGHSQDYRIITTIIGKSINKPLAEPWLHSTSEQVQGLDCCNRPMLEQIP